MSHLVVKTTARIACVAVLELKMDPRELKQWLSSVARLTARQKAEWLTALGAGVDEVQVRVLVESRQDVCPACPHCGATHIVRNGNASGLQRYKCRACQRSFNALTATPMAGLRLEAKWVKQQDALCQGLSVHQSADALGVSPSTAFRWRHRFLRLAQPVKAAALTGGVEADETFFPSSSKGQSPGRQARKRGAAKTSSPSSSPETARVRRQTSCWTRCRRTALRRHSSGPFTQTPSCAQTARRRWRRRPSI